MSLCLLHVLADVPRPGPRGAARRRRERERRSLEKEQESLKTAITHTNQNWDPSSQASDNSQSKDNNLSNNNKDLVATDPTRLRNITNVQLHGNSESAPSSQTREASQASRYPSQLEHSSLLPSNELRTDDPNSTTAAVELPRTRVGGQGAERSRYGRGYRSEGSALHDTLRDIHAQDAKPEALPHTSASASTDLRSRIRPTEPGSQSSDDLARFQSRDYKYRYANGSSNDVPSSEASSSRRRYELPNSRLRGNDVLELKNSNESGSAAPVDTLSSDSSVSSSGTLTISISSPESQSETRIPPDGNEAQTHTQTASRLEGDNISLSSTLSSLSMSSLATTDSSSNMSDAAKRQSVSSLSDLEHLGTWNHCFNERTEVMFSITANLLSQSAKNTQFLFLFPPVDQVDGGKLDL